MTTNEIILGVAAAIPTGLSGFIWWRARTLFTRVEQIPTKEAEVKAAIESAKKDINGLGSKITEAKECLMKQMAENKGEYNEKFKLLLDSRDKLIATARDVEHIQARLKDLEMR